MTLRSSEETLTQVRHKGTDRSGKVFNFFCVLCLEERDFFTLVFQEKTNESCSVQRRRV
jgi:hypothetical protein